MLTNIHQELARCFVGIANEVLVAKGGHQFRALAFQGIFREQFQIMELGEQISFEKTLVEDFRAFGQPFELDILDAGARYEPGWIFANEQDAGVRRAVVW